MTERNPFNFIDPRTRQFPANKQMVCPVEEIEHHETYFNGTHEKQKQRWLYDNYFFRSDPFETVSRRGDRTNIEVRMAAIHAQELLTKVPVCTHSWYGHRPPTYDQSLGESVAHQPALDAMFGRNGMPMPKRNAFGREAAINQTLIEIIKPIIQ